MFIGYQNDKIAFVANTRDELENMPCVILDRIEETGVEYVLHNGEYKPKAVVEVELSIEEAQAKIDEAQKYLDETDWYVVRQAEKGIAIPEEVTIKREEARLVISELRESINA